VAGSPINGMRQLLKATDLAPRIEDIDTRCRAYELCRYCELAFVAHQHIRWSVQQNTQGEALHG
jgi:hypothetical protein